MYNNQQSKTIFIAYLVNCIAICHCMQGYVDKGSNAYRMHLMMIRPYLHVYNIIMLV